MKIKFGAIVTDGRGKIGGHVASKNRCGAYLRTKVTPSNPNTIAQATARGVLASLSQAWRGLTDSQRSAWNSSVNDWANTDIFGDIKNPTGLNLFVKLNSNLANIGSSPLSTPPAKLEMPQAIAVSGTYDISTGVMTILMNDSSADTANVLVRATPTLSQGVSFVKSELRVISATVVATNTVTVTGEYASKFGDPSIGANVYASVQIVLASGQKSLPYKVKLSVVA